MSTIIFLSSSSLKMVFYYGIVIIPFNGSNIKHATLKTEFLGGG
jgi:hypothetical protein